MSDDYTPTTDVVRDAVTFPRRRLGEPRDMTEAAFDRWLAEIRAEALAPIRAALDSHPVCDVHPDDDPVSCGWKRAVADVRAAVDGGGAK